MKSVLGSREFPLFHTEFLFLGTTVEVLVEFCAGLINSSGAKTSQRDPELLSGPRDTALI